MSATLLYLDSSAILKLIVRETETPDLLALLVDYEERASSAIARVEVLRAVRRVRGSKNELRRAADVLARIALIGLDADILTRASELEPAELRSLDALHLATALSTGEDLAALVSYDRRLTLAAKQLAVPVVSPGQRQRG